METKNETFQKINSFKNEDELDEFFRPILRSFRFQLYQKETRHGPGEHGTDILASHNEPLELEVIYRFQMKIGDLLII